MGVPKFFRYLSERYPCLSELAREQSIPEFDNLYFDMNGIIHNCSHPDDGNVHFRITEEEMFKDIFTYIDKLFFLIKPKKLFFMAVDGVAPRAKMNQQRSRRFRSAKDAENLEKAAKLKGEKLPDEARFDSNCITPGTEFMVRLQTALQYFIQSKISTDSLWRRCKVILSGHNHPGEGEHKIMDYIRFLKSQNDYDPNTRHCLYGLDADLIILGLASHEIHFSLLREEVKFGRKNKKVPLEETRFFLLHLGLLREYLELEFDCLKKEATFDIHNLIDDWILMGFLVGNDFIPHLPNFHINMNALPILYKAYCKVYPELGGNINEHGKLNLMRLQKYFEVLGENEFEMFKEHHADLAYFHAKQSNGVDEAFDFDVSEIKDSGDSKTESDLAKMIQDSEMFFNNGEEITSDDEETHIDDEFRLFKRNYYLTKLKYPEMTKEVIQEQTQCYITALQWILYYYYKGVQSWGWYYPHHYAPFISDMKDFLNHEIKFDIGTPFLPFEQLLAVLPAASKELLPEAFRGLMTNSNSELIEYYPKDFETDLNGKKNEWEAVVLIPFIEEKSLLSAMRGCYKDLTEKESARNSHGPMFEYSFTKDDLGEIPGVFGLPRLQKNYALEKHITRDQVLKATKDLVLSERKGVLSDVFFPGFPTMKHLKYTCDLRNNRVRVFDQPSRNESMILKPELREGYNDVINIAHEYLDQIVFIGWPHLTKAKVFAVSNRSQRIDANGVQISDERTFDLHVKTIKEHLSGRMGIELDDYSVIVHVQTLTGVKYICGPEGRMTLSEIWSKTETVYPAQALIKNIASHSESFVQHKKVEDVFTVGSKVFFIGNPYFGSEGVVLDPMLIYTCGRLKISITVLPEPELQAARRIQSHLNEEYLTTADLAARLGIMPNLVSRLTGTIFVYAGTRTPQIPENAKKYSIALQLRFVKQNEEVQGYTKKAGNIWLFSKRCMELIDSYLCKFPMVIQLLSNQNGRDVYFESDLFPDGVDPENNAESIQIWIKAQDYQKSERVPCGTQTLEKEAVLSIIDSIEDLKKQPVKTVKLQVKPFLLLKPEINFSSVEKPKRPFKLFDRVVVVRRTHQVPLGFKGTIVSIHPITDPNPVRLENVKTVDNNYEILFDRELPDGHGIYGIANGRVCKVPETNLVMIFQNANNKNGIPGSEESEKEVSILKRNESGKTDSQKDLPSKAGTNDNGNFWNPDKSDDKKAFMNMLNNASFPRQTPKNKIDINPNTSESISKDPVDETTNQLKFMLGISGTSKQQLGPTKLPQPPVNWKNDALSLNQMPSHNQDPQWPMQNPPMMPFCPPPQRNAAPYPNYHSQKPLVFYTQQLPQFAPQQQLPYVNDNFYSPTYLNQKGAFTPTQVIRCATKNMSKDSKSHKDERQEQPAAGSRSNDSIPQQTKTYFDKTRPKTQQHRQPPPKRRPKIAAKFDSNFE